MNFAAMAVTSNIPLKTKLEKASSRAQPASLLRGFLWTW